VAAIADLLSTPARARLTMLALANQARDTARESTGPGRAVWLCVALALAATDTPGEAQAMLTDMLDSGKLRAPAIACLRTLCPDDTTAGTP
jgi:hypothetical protein